MNSAFHLNHMPPSTPTLQQLQRALSIAEQIQSLEEELKAVLGGNETQIRVSASTGDGATPAKRGPGRPRKGAASNPRPAKGSRKPFSAESRAKMAAAQKARWASRFAGITSPLDALSTASSAGKSGKKGRTMSPEVKARLAAAMKARWAEAKKKGLLGLNAKK